MKQKTSFQEEGRFSFSGVWVLNSRVSYMPLMRGVGTRHIKIKGIIPTMISGNMIKWTMIVLSVIVILFIAVVILIGLMLWRKNC